MKCPKCQKEELKRQYCDGHLNTDGLPIIFQPIDGCQCDNCYNFFVRGNDGSIYHWDSREDNFDGWKLFSKLEKNPKFIGGFKVIQKR